MAEYKAIYKCRLCGQVFHNGTSTGEKLATRCMVEMVAGICGTVAMAPRMHETHYCGGQHAGSLGLADFQGWKKTTQLPPEDKTESGLITED